MAPDLPCDGEGACMVCRATPPEAEIVVCRTCTTPWHGQCLSAPPATLAVVAEWQCPDCEPAEDGATGAPSTSAVATAAGDKSDLIAAIRAIEADASLTEREKAKRRQVLLSGGKVVVEEDGDEEGGSGNKKASGGNDFLDLFDEKFSCAFCMQLPDRPVTVSLSCLVLLNCFTKKAGKANACSGQIFVTIHPDHFGPILAENDPKRNRGVLVGETWEDRMECRQWGAHFPHVAGIAGQSDYGAQSVALSGGYEDDEDHGEWFLYTGRSHKEKRSSYAPETGVRYDGIYRIEKCWRKIGVQILEESISFGCYCLFIFFQGFKVCRYLFVRCDNEPAPWTSEEHGDRPRSLPEVEELNGATDITVRKESPAWDFDDEHGWRWIKPPPMSRKLLTNGKPDAVRKTIRRAPGSSIRERLLKEFSCLLCRKVMTEPLTTPCGHNFCKCCLFGQFADKSFVRQRICAGGRSLRAQKIVKKCPSCSADISDFLQMPQVNRELMELIVSLQQKIEEELSKGNC
ncbi:hypothetical protein ZIOFF_071662 [Zingiber officinale]|uniref:RING-type E3 ubiquitin transferase n=1 Tax=Zingiber officinale TaxID=94328 RepID=A0A8J5C1S8_ZINOF|nr:hypothetical protein ZIOFF_071662 [Zingiber officinale]